MSYITIQTTLPTAVADGSTVEFDYPAGVSSTSFLGSTGHRMVLGGNDLLSSAAGHFSVDFGDRITVTNSSEFTWPAGRNVILQITKMVQTEYDNAIEGTTVDFDLDPLGVNFSTDGLLALFKTASRQQRAGVILPGRYTIDRHLLVESLSDLKLVGGRGVTIEDAGRILRKANNAADFRLPWGVEFVDCGDVDIDGVLFKTVGTNLGGSSSGTYDATNYELRKPVIGFLGCERVRFRRCGHQGNPGQAMDTAAVASTNPVTPGDYAYASLRATFFNVNECFDFIREDCYLVADSCDREQVTFCNTELFEWHRERSVSEDTNFASLGKIIGCKKGVHGGHYVRDLNTTSLIDVIGEDIRFYGANLDFPNGKAYDISQEWGPANQPSRNLRCSNVNSTGRGIVCVGGTVEEMEAGPITDCIIEKCRFNIGETDFSTDMAPSFQGITDVLSIDDVFVNNFPFGRSWNVAGGTGAVRIVRPKLTWTKPSSLVAQARRQSISRGLILYEDVDWLQNASLAGSNGGLASFTFGKDADATTAAHVLRGGRVRDASWAIAVDTTVELHNVTLETFATTGSGTLLAFNCTLNGKPYNTLPPEYADDAAAATGGIPVGGSYRTGSALKTRVS